jgi:hypothetical protein
MRCPLCPISMLARVSCLRYTCEAIIASKAITDSQEAWGEFRRLRTTFAVLLFCEFFLNDLAALFFRSVLHISYPGNFYFGVYAITPVGLFLVGNRLKSWKCPR